MIMEWGLDDWWLLASFGWYSFFISKSSIFVLNNAKAWISCFYLISMNLKFPATIWYLWLLNLLLPFYIYEILIFFLRYLWILFSGYHLISINFKSAFIRYLWVLTLMLHLITVNFKFLASIQYLWILNPIIEYTCKYNDM